ncbi:MAG: prolyl oligopeptidase family serine peptidase, partial [Candidatus Poribacteria bacterium]|nr:prolyl oligopeptidase family serine peptidase [Candidatus Poribacteria bacterium]
MIKWLTIAMMVGCAALASAQDGVIEMRTGLSIGGVSRSGRSPVHTDAVELAIVKGEWTAPKSGDTVTLPDGETRAWETITADDEGWFTRRGLRGGYVYVNVPSESERVMILEPRGHGEVYVNGELRAGNVYGYDWVRLPVKLNAGDNGFLFSVGRGRVAARLVPTTSDVEINRGDTTFPDFRVGEPVDHWAAVILLNTTDKTLDNLTINAGYWDYDSVATPVPPIPPLGVRKVGFRIVSSEMRGNEKVPVNVRVSGKDADGSSKHYAYEVFELDIRQPDQSYKRTFISDIDGSVQYYGVQPAQPVSDAQPALFLSTHGAGVEAIGQANAYSSKTWGHLVAPTNRRPYGFDWEDWGRLDSLEVLEHAQNDLNTDPHRTYLTGHSMGGHGAWILGVTFPDKFAAIGPSAGWISFGTYAGGRGGNEEEELTPVEAIIKRAWLPSDTTALETNLVNNAVYILHGGDDDNVPAAQARTMNERLAAFHHDFYYHEEPGQGHWWNLDNEPGSDCVDWMPMFDLFSRRSIPRNDEIRHVRFSTANPGVSHQAYWAQIHQQINPLEISRVDLRYDPHT